MSFIKANTPPEIVEEILDQVYGDDLRDSGINKEMVDSILESMKSIELNPEQWKEARR